MIVGVCQLTLQLYDNHSLKEKRRIVKGVIERTRARFNVAIAEVDHHDLWQSAVIGISCLSTDTRHANQVLDSVVAFISELALEMEIVNREMSFLPYP